MSSSTSRWEECIKISFFGFLRHGTSMGRIGRDDTVVTTLQSRIYIKIEDK
jgi:hypothetical protein